MTIRRDWATPLAAGAFLVSAATGTLMFFRIESGLGKLAHEWLGWALLAGVALHVAANFGAFVRHLHRPLGRGLIAAAAVVLLLASLPDRGVGDEPPFAPPLRALAAAPLGTLAQVAKLSPEQLRERLAGAGIHPATDDQSLSDLTGADLRAQVGVLRTVFAEAK